MTASETGEADGAAVERALAADPDPLLDVDDEDMAERVRARLFSGEARPQTIGPFEVLERIGSGGMGEVFAARDPRLERRVALKVLRRASLRRGASEQIEQRLRREARALAQLDHPNIVRVFDVGVHDGQLYMAMELVSGQTLRKWLAEAPRTWREVIDVFAQVGTALGVAHDSGLVHRDVKPDNVVVDAHGRARVLDFGLALAFRAGPTPDPTPSPTNGAAPDPGPTPTPRTRGLVGTPGYMAPEQYLRHEPDPATDQFSFCVSFYEALYGRPPLPRDSFATARVATVAGRIDPPPADAAPAWLTRIVMRGLSLEPGDRWPSMETLTAALARGTTRGARIRQRVWLAAGAGLVASAVLVAMPDEPRCPTPVELLEDTWSGARQRLIAERFEATASYGPALWAQLQPTLDAYAQDLVAGMDAVCRQPEQGLRADQRMACFREHEGNLETALALLESADARTVAVAHTLVAELPPTTRCTEARYDHDAPTPQAEALHGRIARLRTRLSAGRYREAEAESLAIVEAARGIDDEALLAAALVVRGKQRLESGHPFAARTVLEEAYFSAARASMDALAGEAATDLVHAALEAGEGLERGLQWARHGHAALDSAGRPRDLALLLISEAHLLREVGRLDDAVAASERAVRVLTRDGGEMTTPVASAHEVLATVLSDAGRYPEAEEHYAAALEGFSNQLGPQHPMTAAATANLGTLLQRQGRPAEAETLHRRALQARRALLRPDHPSVIGGLINLGTVIYLQDRNEEAKALFQEVETLVADGDMVDHPDFAWALNNLGTLQWQTGQFREGEASLTRARRIFEGAYGPDHPAVAGTCNNLGLLAMAEGRLSDAHVLFDQSIGIYRDVNGPEHPEVANLSGNLARLAMAEGELPTAVELSQEALRLRRRGLGLQHPKTLSSIVVAAEALRGVRRFDDALALLDEVEALAVDRGKSHQALREQAKAIRGLIAQMQTDEASGAAGSGDGVPQ
ncbi:MAG: serine/threonine-protein kinase [Myxococcota bacterium]